MIPITLGEKMRISYHDGIVSDDNGNSKVVTTGNACQYPIYIFGINEKGNATQLSDTRIYYLKFYKDDGVVAEYISCYRTSDHVTGFYDTVSRQFYTATKGQGSLLSGDEVYKKGSRWTCPFSGLYLILIFEMNCVL